MTVRCWWSSGPLIGVMLAAASASPAQVTLRRDHPDLSFADLDRMSPAALGDALLAPGHPPIVATAALPEGMAPPFPPGSPVRLSVRLTAATSLDAPSGFCVQHSWAVTIVAPGTADQRDTIEPRTGYSLPIDGGCATANRHFFTVEPADRPRAFTVVRALAAASASAKRGAPGFPVSIDDREGPAMATYLRAHPDPTIPPFATIVDPRVALAKLPVTEIGYVGHSAADADLLAPALLRDRTGRARERWSLFAGGDWTVDVVFDGDRIAAIALRRAVPAPF